MHPWLRPIAFLVIVLATRPISAGVESARASLDASAISYEVIHSFGGSIAAGAEPLTTLTLADDGNLYGTTSSGGSVRQNGMIYRLTPSGSVEVVYPFASRYHSHTPYGALVRGPEGALYGPAANGGRWNYCCGGLFRLDPTNGYAELHQFSREDPDQGTFPSARLLLARDGYFYGVNEGGGKHDQGTLFRMSPDGVVETVHHFGSRPGDGSLPRGGSWKRRMAFSMGRQCAAVNEVPVPCIECLQAETCGSSTHFDRQSMAAHRKAS